MHEAGIYHAVVLTQTWLLGAGTPGPEGLDHTSPGAEQQQPLGWSAPEASRLSLEAATFQLVSGRGCGGRAQGSERAMWPTGVWLGPHSLPRSVDRRWQKLPQGGCEASRAGTGSTLGAVLGAAVGVLMT